MHIKLPGTADGEEVFIHCVWLQVSLRLIEQGGEKEIRERKRKGVEEEEGREGEMEGDEKEKVSRSSESIVLMEAWQTWR